MTQSPVLNGENNTGRVPFTIFNDLYIFRSLSLAHSLLPPIESFSRYFPDIIRRVSFFFRFLLKDGWTRTYTDCYFPLLTCFFLLLFLFIDVVFLFPRSRASFIQVFFFFKYFISPFIPSVEGSGVISLSLSCCLLNSSSSFLVE